MQHGSNIRERHRDIDALAVALDHAHQALISVKTSPDEYQVHENIIAPWVPPSLKYSTQFLELIRTFNSLIQETVLFLDAVGARKRFKYFAGKYIQPGRDTVIARRLLEEFKAAPEQIQVRS